VRIDKNYVFDTPEGQRTLAELFDGRRQLIVQHFMFGPDWEQGRPSCSFMADHSDGMTVHLAHRDVTLVAVSRAPLLIGVQMGPWSKGRECIDITAVFRSGWGPDRRRSGPHRHRDFLSEIKEVTRFCAGSRLDADPQCTKALSSWFMHFWDVG
jgi:hypothetical protein